MPVATQVTRCREVALLIRLSFGEPPRRGGGGLPATLPDATANQLDPIDPDSGSLSGGSGAQRQGMIETQLGNRVKLDLDIVFL